MAIILIIVILLYCAVRILIAEWGMGTVYRQCGEIKRANDSDSAIVFAGTSLAAAAILIVMILLC